MDFLSAFFAGLLRLLVKLILIAMGLVFAVSLLVVVFALALGWGLGALWAKLMGRSVKPWVMRVNARGGWQQFSYRSVFSSRSGAGGSTRREQTDGPALRRTDDVIDVEAKERR